jgi:hypothetical protein
LSSLQRKGRTDLTWATHPNTRRCLTEGFLSCHTSFGVHPSTLRVKEQVRTYTASPQKKLVIFLSFIMLLAMRTTVWFWCLTTPFFCGAYGAVWCRLTLVFAMCAESVLEVNSPPWLVHRVHSLRQASVCASTW